MKRTLPEDFKDNKDSKRTKDILELVKAGDCAAVQSLLDAGADVNSIPPNYYRSLLHKACHGLDVEMVKLLLQYKADPNASIDDYTPAARAIHKYVDKEKDFDKLEEVLKLLRDNGANFNVQSSNNEAIPLLCAARRCDFNLINLLLKLGIDPNIKSIKAQAINSDELDGLCNDDSDMGALHILVLNQKEEDYDKTISSIELLLDHGADYNLQGFYGLTPLHVAMHAKLNDETLENIVRFFINRGANVNIPDGDGNLPLTKIIERQCSLGINPLGNLTKLLIEKLDNPNLQNSKGETLLHQCCDDLEIDINYIKALLNKGANPTISNNRGNFSAIESFVENYEDPGPHFVKVCHLFSQSPHILALDAFDSIGATLFGSCSYHLRLPARSLYKCKEGPNVLTESCRIKAIKEIARYMSIFERLSHSGLYKFPDDSFNEKIIGFLFAVNTPNEIWHTVYCEFKKADITLLERTKNVYNMFCCKNSFRDNEVTQLFLEL